MANQLSAQNTGSVSNQGNTDSDADDKPNNGSKLHRARDQHSDDAPAQNRASDKLAAEARQLVKPSRQGSGPITGGIQQDVDDGQQTAGGDGEQDSADAQDQKADGQQNEQSDGKLKGQKAGTHQASNGDANKKASNGGTAKSAKKAVGKSGASASSKQSLDNGSKQDRSSNSGKMSGSAIKGKDGGTRHSQSSKAKG